MSMEGMEEQLGKCGMCGMQGPLSGIQNHFMNEHVIKDVHEENDEGNVNVDEVKEHLWRPENILLLIRLVEHNHEKFNSGLKKNVWLSIASQISKATRKQYTWEQVDNKWKGLKKTYIKIKDANNRTGNNPTRWEFFEAMNSFMGGKPEICPPAVCSTSGGLKINQDQSAKETQATTKASRTDYTSTLMKKRKRNEDLQQKRHEEKLARYDRFLDLLEKSVEVQKEMRNT